MKKKGFILWCLTLICGMGWIGCEHNMPSQPDGSFHLIMKVEYTNEAGDPVPVPSEEVTLTSHIYNVQQKGTTDNNGIIEFDSLPVSLYSVFVDFQAQLDSGTVARYVYSGNLNLSSPMTDTIRLGLEPAVKNLIIHEFYYSGLRNDSVRLYDDQFIELINPTSEIQYLDGLVIGKGYKTLEENESKFVTVSYAYKFPGMPGEQNYPVDPGALILIARNALNYGELIEGHINLKNADWETVSAVESEGDSDDPSIPNLVPINDYSTYQKDIKFSLTSGILILFPFQDFEKEDRYLKIPATVILDGIEYNRNNTGDKKLDDQIDSGIAGVGIGIYSGQSIQRKKPWLDTNNSTNDFEVLSNPTPGTF